METVTVKIDPKTGEMTFEVAGVMGGKCNDITAALTAAHEVQEHEVTAEACEVEELPDYVYNPEVE